MKSGQFFTYFFGSKIFETLLPMTMSQCFQTALALFYKTTRPIVVSISLKNTFYSKFFAQNQQFLSRLNINFFCNIVCNVNLKLNISYIEDNIFSKSNRKNNFGCLNREKNIQLITGHMNLHFIILS